MSSEQRPRRLGYAIGAAFVAIGAVVAITLTIVFLVQVTSKVPTSDHSFGNNQATTVHVNAGESKSIYIAYTTSDSNINCKIFGNKPYPRPGDVPYLRRYNFDFIPTSVWRARFYFQAKDGGDYRITCSGPPDVRYGVGEYVGAEKFMLLFSGIAVGIVLGISGFATVIITALRRATQPRPPM
jgi:hypothetical protein